ncbi:MAG: VWA domain-containing protein [Spirochaetales bacterium]|nr:VWA domain-containing protein [Spirochaetales bacterium]
MKSKIMLSAVLLGLMIFPGIIWSQNITITQIDSTGLLPFSKIDCYLSISDGKGEIIENIDSPLISIRHETSEGMDLVEILDVQRNDFSIGQITFLLVLDNSGSMYDPVGNGSTGTRMDHAVRAVKEFLRNIDNSNVRVGLAVFNTRYNLIVKPVNDFKTLETALDSIAKPVSEDAYTELYYSIDEASKDMSVYRGRKAILILSDGENYPFYTKSGKLHPDFGEYIYLPEDSLDSLKNESVTLYGINFSSNKDPFLSSISIDSGGEMYNAYTDKELSGIYSKIKNRIEMEYKVTIQVPLNFLEMPELSAEYKGKTDTLDYYSSPLMGKISETKLMLIVFILLFSLGVWFLLLKLRFERPADSAELSMLPYGNGKALKQTVALTSMNTIIGGSAQADFTVTGIPDIKESHATIVQDEKAGTYTVISDEEIKVNNQITRKRKLKPGDVINIEGATIVFDAPED